MRNDKIKGATIVIAGGEFEQFERTPLEVNNGGLKAKTVDFQLLANSGGMENKQSVSAFKLPCKKTPKVSGKY